LRGIRPKRVHEKDNIHYFFWTWDLYKLHDYEPIIVHSNSNSKIVVSRFHWNLATIWTEPVEEEGLPNVGFVPGVHTPIVESKSKELRYVEFDSNISVQQRMEMTDIYIPLFCGALRMVEFGEEQKYEDLIVNGQVPKKYLFSLDAIKCAVLIGCFPKPDDLPEALRTKLWPEA
jgi:hypothetical protein